MMESASALRLSLLASGHSDRALIALIWDGFCVSDSYFRAPSTPQRRNDARSLGNVTAIGAADDGISKCSAAIIAS